MPRVKRGTSHVKSRKNLLQDVKGYKWGRKKLIKLAKTARTLAGAHAYVDRNKKKRDMRALWQIRLNAFVREYGLSYSKFMGLLKANNIELDRKVLSEMAINNKQVLAKIIEKIKK
ncbi:MAG: 50S ribosomal protein L20 [Patescibacteria group bacterium]